MKYSQPKKRLCIRMDRAHIEACQSMNLSINRTVNAALEAFIFDIDHKLADQWRKDDIISKSSYNREPYQTQVVQLRIEAMFYDRAEMLGWVKSKLVWHAMEIYLHRIASKSVAEWKLTELKMKRS